MLVVDGGVSVLHIWDFEKLFPVMPTFLAIFLAIFWARLAPCEAKEVGSDADRLKPLN